jgi:RNA polymerase sigma factor (sigma-70 family)
VRRRSDPVGRSPEGASAGAAHDPLDAHLAAARGGDGAAFEALYRVMGRRLYAFVAARGAADPEGIVDEVFLRVFRNLSSFDGGTPQFQAWVFAIARNALVDEHRRRQRRVAELHLDEVDQGGTGNAEDEAVGQLGAQWAIRQLDVLTAEQREVLLLRVVADLSLEVIADLLGKPVGAVKSMQRRALRTLERHLAASGVSR